MTNCPECNSNNISHKERIGRSLSPKGWVRKDNRKISWKGTWDVWTCNDCGHSIKKIDMTDKRDCYLCKKEKCRNHQENVYKITGENYAVEDPFFICNDCADSILLQRTRSLLGYENKG